MEVLWIRKWRVLEAPMQTVSLGLHASYTIELQKEMGMTTNLIDEKTYKVEIISPDWSYENKSAAYRRLHPQRAWFKKTGQWGTNAPHSNQVHMESEAQLLSRKEAIAASQEARECGYITRCHPPITITTEY
jgi:hypothetical protein